MKRVLIITYYWPPSGGIGVLRCLKFAKYFRQFGWEPIIYTASNPQYPYIDHSNDKDVPEGVEILKHPIFEPFSLFKKITRRKKDEPISNPLVTKGENRSVIEKLAIWIRANFFIPDARALWIKPSVKFLSQYLRENKVDAILSNGPPHTNSIIACRLAQQFSVPWLADFQDPWTQVDYYSLFPIGKRADRIHKRMEQEVFKTASKITIVSPAWKRDLEEIGAKDVDVVYWGYDEDDFKNLSIHKEEKFQIVHAGILGEDRYAENFFIAISELCNEFPEFERDLHIRFFGMVDHSIQKSIQENNIAHMAQLEGTKPRNEILSIVASADLLLLPLNKSKNINGRIPGKLFEYLRTQVPILCIGPQTSDVALILSHTGAGKTFEYEDKVGIKTFIKSNYENYNLGLKTKTNIGAIEQFNVINQTKSIAKLLNNISTRSNVKS
ncbi:MAG: glycosyltransferase [Cyclobacteriaceae bacterium]|nr:glycosyltransferase [Cyclobacteriaceae bacterium]